MRTKVHDMVVRTLWNAQVLRLQNNEKVDPKAQ